MVAATALHLLHPAATVKPPSAMANGGSAPNGADMSILVGDACGNGKGKGKAVEHDLLPQQLVHEASTSASPWTDEEVDRWQANELGSVWDPSLVPLHTIVERTVERIYKDLRTYVETAPSMRDFDRKKSIIDLVIHSRRQLIKLLVMVKWSSNASAAHRLMAIIGFLRRQNDVLGQPGDLLQSARDGLTRARARNYDIPAALSVLSTGSWTLPSRLLHPLSRAQPLDDASVYKTLNQLDQVLRWKLAMDPFLPDDFRQYQICDGKVKFRVRGMFEAIMTVDGPGKDARWILLRLQFLFIVKDPRGRSYTATPKGQERDQLLSYANHELSGGIHAPTLPPHPLILVHSFLVSVCLRYQLEALHAQAAALARTRWASHVIVTSSATRTSLVIGYWMRTRTQPAGPRVGRPITSAPTRHALLPQGTITFSLDPGDASSSSRSDPSSSTSVGSHKQGTTRNRVMAALSRRTLDNNTNSVESCCDVTIAQDRRRLRVDWSPFGYEPPLSDVERVRSRLLLPSEHGKDKESESSMNTSDLDLESVLTEASILHADWWLQAAIRSIRNSTAARHTSFPSARLIALQQRNTFHESESSNPIGESEHNATKAEAIDVHLHGRDWVNVRVDGSTGTWRLGVERRTGVGEGIDHAESVDANGEAGMGGEQLRALLKNAGDRLNDQPNTLGEVLLKIRCSMLLEELESKATYLGLTVCRHIAVHLHDIAATPPPLNTASTLPPPTSGNPIAVREPVTSSSLPSMPNLTSSTTTPSLLGSTSLPTSQMSSKPPLPTTSALAPSQSVPSTTQFPSTTTPSSIPSPVVLMATYIVLPQNPQHFLTLVVNELGITCHLIVLKESGKAMFEIGYRSPPIPIPNVNVETVESNVNFEARYSMSEEQLQSIYTTCINLMTYNSITRQCVSFNIPVKTQQSLTPNRTTTTTTIEFGPLCIPVQATTNLPHDRVLKILCPVVSISLKRNQSGNGDHISTLESNLIVVFRARLKPDVLEKLKRLQFESRDQELESKKVIDSMFETNEFGSLNEVGIWTFEVEQEHEGERSLLPFSNCIEMFLKVWSIWLDRLTSLV